MMLIVSAEVQQKFNTLWVKRQKVEMMETGERSRREKGQDEMKRAKV